MFISSIKTTIRSIYDNIVIIYYLESLSDFMNSLKQSFGNVSDLLKSICISLKYEYLEKSNIIFKIGDKGDKFYILLKGKATIYKAKASRKFLTEADYLKYLIKLKYYNETYLLNQCLNNKHNCTIFNLADLDFNAIEHENHKRHKKAPVKRAKDLFNYNTSSPLKFRRSSPGSITIDQEKFNELSHSFCITNIKKFDQNYLELLKPNVTKEDSHKLLELEIYTYNKFLTLTTGMKFGESALDDENKKR